MQKAPAKRETVEAAQSRYDAAHEAYRQAVEAYTPAVDAWLEAGKPMAGEVYEVIMQTSAARTAAFANRQMRLRRLQAARTRRIIGRES